jgi:CBS domain containing-hemolysin-like protein
VIWLVVAIGLLIAVFGATAGAALITVSRAELTRAVGRRLRGAAPSLSWLAEVDADLTAASATTSLGVLVVGAALPGLLAGSGRPLPVVLVALVGVPLVLLAAYLVPRWLTLPRAQGVADRVMPLLRPWSRVLGLVLPARTAKRPTDLRSIWREGAAVGLRADDELVMVGGVMAFSVRPVREVMTPRTDLVAVDEHAALADIRLVFAQSGYSRIPVYRGTLDEIVGMLHAFDLFKLRPGDPLPVRPVAVTPASRACGDLLLDMQRERRHLAVVLDEFGGTLGIATLEDLLEELVGEIFDEHDEEVRPEPAGGPTIFETDGNVPPEAIEERFGVALPAGRSTTVAGLIVEWAGRIPNPGERFLIRGLELDILEASPTRIERLIIRAGGAPTVTLPSGAGGGTA